MKGMIVFFALLIAAGCSDGKKDTDAGEDVIAEHGEDIAAEPDLAGEPDAAGDPDGEEGAPWTEKRLVILHTNDEHSHLLGTGPSVDDWPLAAAAGDGSMKGNIYRRAIVLNALRAEAAGDGVPTVTVSAGDYTMGTLFHLGSALAGVDYKLMTLLGYGAATIGNHEFDFGASTLATMLKKGGLLEGLPLGIPVVSSNIHFSSGTGDDALQALYSYDGSDAAALLKGYHVAELPGGLRVGFIGITGLSAALVAPFKSPIQFSLSKTTTPCVESYECANGSCVGGFCTAGALQDHAAHLPALVADAAQAVRDVRAEGVDIVVALSHSGLDDREAAAIVAGTLDPAGATGSEDILLARGVGALLEAEGLGGIDVIVGGHSHTLLPEPIVARPATDSENRTVIVQAGSNGYWVGRLEVYKPAADSPWLVDAEGSAPVEVDDSVDPADLPTAAKGVIDDAVTGVMAAVEAAILEDGLNIFNPGTPLVDDTAVPGDLFFAPLAESAFDVRGELPFRESAAMHLVTDALREIINGRSLTDEPVKVYVQANGVLRDSILRSADGGGLSVADVFNLVPLGVSPVEESPGYPVIDFYMSAAELKAGLEVGLSLGLSADNFYLGYSGVKVEYDPGLPAFDPAHPTTTGRITKMTLWDPDVDMDHDPWDDDYSDVIFDLAATPDPFSGRAAELVHVASNLYIGLYIENFGLCPRDATGAWDPLCGLCANDDADCEDGAGGTAHCLDDAVSTGVGRCVASSYPAVIHYILKHPDLDVEVKEWTGLMGFLMRLPDGDADTIPDLPDAYDMAASPSRYPSRTCCVKFPATAADTCCRAEPCATDFLPCP